MCKLRLAFQPLLLATKWTCLDCQKAIHAKPIGLHDRNCSRYVRRRNTRCLPVSMTQAATQGKIQYSVVESHKNKYLRIQYKPPVDYFRSGQDLFFTGGYNNWNGIDDPLILPLNQKVRKGCAGILLDGNFSFRIQKCMKH